MGDVEIIEMFWKCKACGRVNPGLSSGENESKTCANCGNIKSDEPWLMPDDIQNATEVTDPKLLEMALAGENWTCASCRYEERYIRTTCTVCGAKKPGTEEDLGQRDARVLEESFHPPSVALPRVEQEPSSQRFDLDMEMTSEVQSFYKKPWLLWASILISVGLLVAFFVWLFAPNQSLVAIRNMRWSRTETLMERHVYHDEAWRSAMHGESINERCDNRLKGHRNCNPHNCRPHSVSYECNCTGGNSYSCNCQRSCTSNKNGSASCTNSCSTCTTPRQCSTCSRTEYDTCYDRCPIYEDWCAYDYRQWDAIDTKSVGGNDQKLAWPGMVEQSKAFPQRIDRKQVFFVEFAEVKGDRLWKMEPNESEYLSYDRHATYLMEWDRAGSFRLLGKR